MRQIHQVQTLITSGLSPLTSSLGRLFDGIASLVLGISFVEYEGEAATRLEAVAAIFQTKVNRSKSAGGSSFVVEQKPGEVPLRIDWCPVVRQVVSAMKLGRPAEEIARDFHRAVAEMIVMVVSCWPDAPIVLTGGCFQNRLLTEMVIHRLQELNHQCFTHSDIPANDGGLAVGQLAVAAAILDLEAQLQEVEQQEPEKREAQQGASSCA